MKKIVKLLLIAVMLASLAGKTIAQGVSGFSPFFVFDTRFGEAINGYSAIFGFDTRLSTGVSGLSPMFVFDTRTGLAIAGSSAYFSFDTRTSMGVSGFSPAFLFDTRTNLPIAGLSPFFLFDTHAMICPENNLRGGPPETNPPAAPVQITGVNAPPQATDLSSWTGNWQAPQAIFDQGEFMDDADHWSNPDGNPHAGSSWQNQQPGVSYGILVVDLKKSRRLLKASVFQMFSEGKTTHIAFSGNPETGSTPPDANDAGWFTMLSKTPVGSGSNQGSYIRNPAKFELDDHTRYVKIMAWNDGSLGNSDYIQLKGVKMFCEMIYEPGIRVDLYVCLEGPYNGTEMTTALNSAGLIPLSQPYHTSPWDYAGTEDVGSIPKPGIVDWVLVDVMEETWEDAGQVFEVLERKAAFLHANGQITATDGFSPLKFSSDINDPFYIGVHHRNHLKVISSGQPQEVDGTFSWDFTTGADKNLGGMHTQKEISSGTWGMIAGDGDADCHVDNMDKNEVWLPDFGLTGYLPGDFNLDGEVNLLDKNYWDNNAGRSSFAVTEKIIVWVCGDPVTDIDGNVYGTVQIGNQCWMKENLKTTTYKNGTSIPNVTDDLNWSNLTTGAYVWYGNDISWKDSYGALYNWFATVDANGLCPTGWHVPTHNEWTALTDYIGGTGSPNGNKLKSCRQVNSPLGSGCNTTEHPRWEEDTWNGNYGTDGYGFSGLPGGARFGTGYFDYGGYYGLWWSSTEDSSTIAWFRYLANGYGDVAVTNYNKPSGFSIRCLRND